MEKTSQLDNDWGVGAKVVRVRRSDKINYMSALLKCLYITQN